MAKENLIKVRIDGESFWAKSLKNNTAEVRNIPFQGVISLHDIVKIDNENNIIKIIKKKTIQASIEYAYHKRTVQEEWKQLVKYFEKNKIEIEGMVIGYASLAVPLKMTKKKFR